MDKFQIALYTVYSLKICVFILTKFNWCKSCSLMTVNSEACLLNNRLLNIYRCQFVEQNRFSSMKHIFTLMALLSVKITTFRTLRTLVWLPKNKCIYKVSLFVAGFGLEVLLDHTSSKMKMIKHKTFPDHVLRCLGGRSKSCDLTPFDFLFDVKDICQ